MFQDLLHRLRFHFAQLLDERRLADGLIGIPALLALALLMFLGLYSIGGLGVEALERLENEAKGQLEQQRFAEARILARRLATTPSKNLAAVVIEAKALRGMGKVKESARVLARIASLDQAGYAPAHVVQAAVLLGQEKPDPEAALRHIEHALRADATNQDALELAARFAAGQQRWDSVLKYLDQMDMEKRADLLLMKATALQMTGMTDESVKCARRAEESLREMEHSAGSGADRIRYSIAVSLSLQRRYEAAVQWMMEATQRKLNKEDCRVLGGIYLSWSRDLKKQPAPDKAKILEMLAKAIQLSPESQDIIMAFLTECEDMGAADAEKRRYVQSVLGEGGGMTSSFLHYYLGVQEWKLGKREVARSHFELASSLNPGFRIITNNLAMALASVSTNQEELERALGMMNELISQEPDNPHFLDTRGHVYAKLGKLKEAVADFERALPYASARKPSVHSKLAELYQQLGMNQLAVEHRTASLATVTFPAAQGLQ